MNTRRLGNSDLEITPIGIGAWAMGGGGWKFAWGPQDDTQSIEAIRTALDAGLNWIDTAAVYGLGHSEEVVGRALQGVSPKPYIFTKCERTWNAAGEIIPNLKPASLRLQCEASLKRLRIDVIDLYQVHWPQPEEDIEEGWAELARLKEAGKVRWIGVSNFNLNQLKRAAAIAPVTSLQPPYSLLARQIEMEAFPYCAEHGIGVLAYSPMKSGLLTGKMTRDRIAAFPPDDFRARVADFQEPKLTRNLALAAKLGEVAARRGRTAGEAAIAWVLRHPAVTAAIVGMRSAAQAREMVGAKDFRLTPEEIAEIESFAEAEGVWR